MMNNQVNTFRKSALVVKDATGEEPPADNLPPETEARLSAIRKTKKMEFFISTFQWNKALSGLTEESVRRARWAPAIEDLVQKAGYPHARLCDVLDPSYRLAMPTAINKYVQWKLGSVQVVSPHSAIFHFKTKDLKR